MRFDPEVQQPLRTVSGTLLSRRTVLRHALMLGLSVPTVASLLAACGSDDDEEPTPADDAGAAPTKEPDAEPTGATEEESEPTEATDDEPESTEAEPAEYTGASVELTTDEEWIIGLNAEATGIDPVIFGGTSTDPILGHVFEGLVDVATSDLVLLPKLAESWERVDDLTWRFNIRQGVQFHNGDPMTAEDVKFSFDIYMDPDAQPFRGPYTRLFESVEMVDEFTVDFTTRIPTNIFFTDLTRLFIIPKSAYEADPESFSTVPIGTGPYKVNEWRRDDRMILDANGNYWRGQVAPPRLVLRPITDATTRMSEIQAGGVKVIYGPPIAQLNSVAQNADLELVASKGARSLVYAFNVTAPPFDDERVRQAFNYAIDRELIVETIVGGHGIVMSQPLVSGWLGHNSDVEPYPYDPDRARELLAEAGYADGLSTSWRHTTGAFPADVEIAQAIAAQLREVGVDLELVPTEYGAIQEAQAEGNFDGMISGSWTVQRDPDAYLSWYFVDKPGFVNPELRDMVLETRAESDPEKREQLLMEFSQRAHEVAHWLEVYVMDELWVKQADTEWQLFPYMNSKSYSYYFDTRGLMELEPQD